MITGLRISVNDLGQRLAWRQTSQSASSALGIKSDEDTLSDWLTKIDAYDQGTGSGPPWGWPPGRLIEHLDTGGLVDVDGRPPARRATYTASSCSPRPDSPHTAPGNFAHAFAVDNCGQPDGTGHGRTGTRSLP